MYFESKRAIDRVRFLLLSNHDMKNVSYCNSSHFTSQKTTLGGKFFRKIRVKTIKCGPETDKKTDKNRQKPINLSVSQNNSVGFCRFENRQKKPTKTYKNRQRGVVGLHPRWQWNDFKARMATDKICVGPVSENRHFLSVLSVFFDPTKTDTQNFRNRHTVGFLTVFLSVFGQNFRKNSAKYF